LERRANSWILNLSKGLNIHFIIVAILCLPSVLQGQVVANENSETYILGGVKVTGLQSYNEQTVVTFSKLRVGQEIEVPGEQLSDVIKRLWDLDLFTDVSVYQTEIRADTIFLELDIRERPTLSQVTFFGIKEKKAQELIDDTGLKKGRKITESLIANSKNFIENKYREKGFLNAQAQISTRPDTVGVNSQKMVVNVKTGAKVKIKDIEIIGNEKLSDRLLRSGKGLKKTKKKKIGRFWKASKFIEEDYKEDLKNIIDTYAERGYRDARILSDTVIRLDEKNIALKIELEEGERYYFGDIDFVGNTVYSDQQLSQVLGISKGDPYNGVQLKKRIADETKPDAVDITNLYQNNGYLFSRISPVEISAVSDTIDFEIRIIEGKETYLDHVWVNGNDKTNDHVIYREIRTKPGQKYSKDNIVRTIRELGQLGFFDAEQISPDIQNPDPNSGTVDIRYNLVESGSSQIELQGGVGGGGFIGTLGLSFNNFSMQNIFNKDAYKPVPMGDGQRFALRLQASRTFRVYSLNFVEPWFGGKKPVSFNMSFQRTQQFSSSFRNGRIEVDRDRGFSITGISAGLSKRVTWPDDFFVVSHAASMQFYNFNNFNNGLFNFGNGSSNSLTYTFGLSRSSQGPSRIFPLSGSNFQFTTKLTPPWSLFSSKDYKAIREEIDEISSELLEIGTSDPAAPALSRRLEELEEERFKWLEFFKVKFQADWYTRLVDKLVLRTNAEFGFLGSYNNDIGDVPFERFFVGGDGLGNFTLDGRDVIQLRGYENSSLTPFSTNPVTGRLEQEGGTIYNKFSLELRYPFTLKPTASIYGLTFLEAGNSFSNFNTFNPFELKRSAGIGLRIFMPAFGLLGIDFGYGFDRDNNPSSVGVSGWQTHFIIGQQF